MCCNGRQVVRNRTDRLDIVHSGMHVTQPSSPRMAKSTSLGLLDHDGDMYIVDKDDIIGLTQDVKNFSDGLSRLKELFNEQFDSDEDLKVLAHERLGDVLCTLKSVLQSYPPLNTTELFSAAGALIGKIKCYNYEEHNVAAMEGAFNDAIDQLALEFSNSVSEYLMGDLHHGAIEEVKTKSYDNLLSVPHEIAEKADIDDEKEEPVVQLTAVQIDGTLMNLQAGLELAFQRAKAWSKYLKDVMLYIERRAQLEVEYSRNLSRLATSVKPALTEEGFLPLQSVYCTVLSQDVEYSKTCQATFTLLQTTKFVEPLTLRRNEHDKSRKSLKDTWYKEVKKMQESINNLKKAQTLYVTRQQEYEKAKELSQKTESDMLSHSNSSSALTAKVDKKKKAEDDASHKAAEAETTYKACVAEANNRQAYLQYVKTDHLAAIREQIYLSDQMIQKVTIDYFQLLQTVSAPVPVQYHTLCEASKRYEAGSQYGEFVRRLPVSTCTSVQYEEFKFEPYNTKGEIGNRKVSMQSNESEPSDHHSGESSPNLNSPRRQDKYRVPVRGAWTPQGVAVNSDTDSQSGSSKSLDSSPSNSPYPSGHKKMVLTGSMDDLIEDDRDISHGVKQLLNVPGTELVDPQSIVNRPGRRRNTTFGVDFQEQVEHYHSAIPPIISKCLKEVEKRGITVKGIYRVSGVKSTVENLCQRFESDPESVVLEAENPNVISNVLKLYLRQLPEPLLTFKLYQNFVHTAKDNISSGTDMEQTVEKLHDLIDKLPFSNRKTCGVLMHHLQRVASYADQNHMNASNLGIVFGPTLLRPHGGNSSLACLTDTIHQTRVVELLIVHAEDLFGPIEDHQLIPGETPVEPMEKTNTLQVPQQATIELSSADTATKHVPKKETMPSPTISLSTREQLLRSHSPASLREPVPSKKQGEDILLPGSTNFDKKESSNSRASSDGEENEVANGVDHEMCSDSDIESDDDDILLPDDSHRSKHGHDINRQGDGAIVKNAEYHPFMTPPLTTRRDKITLKSPASSPNLSIRSAISSPPAIRIEDSILESTDGVSDTDQATNWIEDYELSTNQQRIFQLPPINSWVPKGESMFSSILDSRSPQVYRRTNTPSSKTASYPPSSQNILQGSRVSWPQICQIQPLEATCLATNTVPDTVPGSSKTIQLSKSPRLLRKCTSFDFERSRPFPSRSMMSSPMLVRRSTSFEETDTLFNASDHNSKGSSQLIRESGRISYQEEDENTSSTTINIDVPKCRSVAKICHHDTSIIEAIAGDNAVKYLVMSTVDKFDAARINESLEDPSIQETDILDDILETHIIEETSLKEKSLEITQRNNLSSEEDLLNTCEETDEMIEQIEFESSAVRKTKETKETMKQPVAKTSNKPILGKSSSKDDRSTDKLRPKTPASTVKSALLTSAAKLKAIGRKSPVRLLSYKSHSISIPDHSRKSHRPSSVSELNLAARPNTSRIHQTESSPTVLVASHVEQDDSVDLKENMSIVKSLTPPMKKAGISKRQQSYTPLLKSSETRKSPSPMPPLKKSVTSKRRSPTPPMKKSGTTKNPDRAPLIPSVKDIRKSEEATPKMKPTLGNEEKKVKKDKWATTFKSSSDKQGKGSTKAAAKPSQGQKTCLTGQTSKEPSSASSASLKGSTAAGQQDSLDQREKKRISKQSTKRGSISSINSDSSKPSDHFRDCCHGRRKPDKK